MTWGAPSSLSPQLPVLLAAQDDTLASQWQQQLSLHPQITIAGIASDLDMLGTMRQQAKFAIVDALIFGSGVRIVEIAQQYDGFLYVQMPAQAADIDCQDVENAARNIRIARKALDLQQVVDDILANAETAAPTPQPAQFNGLGRGLPNVTPSTTGLKRIAVWNLIGGVGKSTVAANLALEASRRGYPTLLIELGYPSDFELMLAAQSPQRNLSYWYSNPSVDTLKGALREKDGLALLTGFNTRSDARHFAQKPSTARNSMKALMDDALNAGYSVVIVDTPQTDVFHEVLAACNMLLLVARPMLVDAKKTIEAFRYFTSKMQHSIPIENTRLVMNMIGNNTGLDPRRFHSACVENGGGSDFPPIVASLYYSIKVQAAQNQQQAALIAADGFRKGIETLADNVLGMARGNNGCSGFSIKNLFGSRA